MTPTHTLDIITITVALSIAMILITVMVHHVKSKANFAIRPAPKSFVLPGSEAARDAIPPLTDRTAYCYVAGTIGLRQTKNVTGRSWWKVGCVGPGPGSIADRLANRMRDLDVESYASATQTEDGWIRETGFSHWQLQPIHANPRPDCPAIQILPFAIAVTLPPTISFGEFEARFRGALRRWSLERFLGNAVYGRRFTPRVTGYSVASELFTLRPKRKADIDLIVAAIASVIGDHPADDGRSEASSGAWQGTRRHRLVPPAVKQACTNAITHRYAAVDDGPRAHHRDETLPHLRKGGRRADWWHSRTMKAPGASDATTGDLRPAKRPIRRPKPTI